MKFLLVNLWQTHPPHLHEEQLFDVTQQQQHQQGRGWDVSIDDSVQIRLVIVEY